VNGDLKKVVLLNIILALLLVVVVLILKESLLAFLMVFLAIVVSFWIPLWLNPEPGAADEFDSLISFAIFLVSIIVWMIPVFSLGFLSWPF
jgi:hypothetical protein